MSTAVQSKMEPANDSVLVYRVIRSPKAAAAADDDDDDDDSATTIITTNSISSSSGGGGGGGGSRPNSSVAIADISANISCLYPEILALIFGYLDVRDKGRVAQVCVAWRDAAYHRSVWRGVESRLHLRRTNPYLFPSLVRRGIRRVQVLSISRRRSLDVGALRKLVHIPNLESLNFCGCYTVTDELCELFFTRDLPTLTVLNLSLCKSITDSSLARIAKHLKNLLELELGGTNLTNVTLTFVKDMKKLKSLNLRSCRHISDVGISHLADGNLELEFLGLQDCQKVTDDALRNVSVGLQYLKSINLSFCASVTDSGLKHVARMASLRELNLRSCDNISDVGLAYLATGGSLINTLDVSFCDKIGDLALLHISQGLFNLRSLSLNACQVSDDGVARIARSLHELETLNIGQCSRITDKGLQCIAEHAGQLRHIDLYGCHVTTVGLEKIMQLPHLSVLNLGLWHKR